MVYNKQYFTHELQKSFLDGKGGRLRLLVSAALLALFSIVINSIFLTLQDTVLSGVFPQFSERSFFSLVSLLNVVILFYYAVFFGQNYNSFTFAEIDDNRWYLLHKIGYSSTKIVAIRQFSTLAMCFVIYALSYILLFVFAAIFGFTVVSGVMLPLCIAGLTQLMFAVSVTVTFSLFVAKPFANFVINIALLLAMLAGSKASGFDAIATNSDKLLSLNSLFVGGAKWYPLALLIGVVLTLLVSSLVAAKKSNYYYPKTEEIEGSVYVNPKNGKQTPIKAKTVGGGKAIKITVMSVISILLILGILANVAIAFLGSKDDNQAFTIKGYTPVIFSSKTMTGDIEKNDLAVFKAVQSGYTFKTGDVVLFYKNGKMVIKKVVNVADDGALTLNVNNHATDGANGATEIIDGDLVSGVLVETNGWLGAWMLFNNTLFGKIVTLIIPLLILGFYDKLRVAFRAFRNVLNEE